MTLLSNPTNASRTQRKRTSSTIRIKPKAIIQRIQDPPIHLENNAPIKTNKNELLQENPISNRNPN